MSYPPQTPQERYGSLGGLIVQALLGLVAFVAILALAARYLTPPPNADAGLPELGSTVLTDGTTVKIMAVTVGTTHRVDVPRPAISNWERFWGTKRTEVVQYPTPENVVVVWLVRHQPASSSMEVFDALRHAKLEWGADRAQRNTTVWRIIHGQFGNSTSTGTPPFSSAPTGPHDIVFTNLQFPLLADPGSPVRLRLVGDASAELGTINFTLPSAGLPVTPVWTPLPLPQTQTVGHYSATLVSIDSKEVPDGRVTIRAKVETAFEGRAAAHSTHSIGQLRDPLGNASGAWECELDRGAAAWSLPVHARFRVDPAAEPDAVWKSPPLMLPKTPAESVPTDVLGTLRGGRVGIQLAKVCGSKTPPMDPSPWTGAAGHGHWSYSTHIFNKPVLIDHQVLHGTPSLQVAGDFPYVCVKTLGLAPEELLVLTEVKDDVARDVRFYPFQHQGITLYFLDPLPDAKSVTLGIGIDERVEFDFRIAPPRRPAP